MYADEKKVIDETLDKYKHAVDFLLDGFQGLEKLIGIREHPALEGYRKGKENLAIANSICVVRIYKTLNVIKNCLISGYYTEAISLLRNIVELQIMIRYFSKKPEKAELWLQNKFEPKYGNMCDELGMEKEGRQAHYKMLCEHTHPNFKGNLFFSWDLEKLKETKELHFTIQLHNTFNEFIFLGILNHLYILISDIQIQQMRTLNLTKEAIDEWVRGAMGIEVTPINEVFSEMIKFQENVKESHEYLLKRMIEIAKERGVPDEDLSSL